MKRKIKRNLNLPESDMERLNRRLFRKRLRLIVRIVSAVLVMAVIAFAALCILCRVQDITVSNSSPYSDEALVSRISDSYGTSLVLFDSDSAVQKLRSAFPYLKTIKVKTVFPHEIHISVTSSEPVYSLLVADGEYLYLDGDLKVLEQSGLSRTGTVLVRGMTVSTYKVGSRLDRNINLECTTLCRIKELMDGVGLGSRITEIDMTKKYNYRIILDNLISVEVGNSADLDLKINLARQILDSNPVLRKATVDVHDYEKGRYKPEN